MAARAENGGGPIRTCGVVEVNDKTPVIIEYDPCKQPVFWYVVFSRQCTNLMPWPLRWLTRNGYRHCYAFRNYNGITLTVNHLAQGMIVDASPVPAPDCVATLISEGRDTVVLFAGQLKYCYLQRGIQSCVSVVKSLIGLKAWHVLTPQQLFEYLSNNGGVVLWEAAEKSYSQVTQNAAPSTNANGSNSPDASS